MTDVVAMVFSVDFRREHALNMFLFRNLPCCGAHNADAKSQEVHWTGGYLDLDNHLNMFEPFVGLYNKSKSTIGGRRCFSFGLLPNFVRFFAVSHIGSYYSLHRGASTAFAVSPGKSRWIMTTAGGIKGVIGSLG